MNKNKIIIASAGSWKTRTLVEEAILIAKKFPNKNVLITTFTEANEQSIKNKIIQKTGGYIPENIIVQTRFSFLLEHWVKPFQSELDDDLWGKNVWFCFVDKKSAQKFDETWKAITFISSEWKENPIYWWENENFNKHYFNSNFQIYSDKISKFVIRCDKKTKEEKKDIWIIIERISKIFSHIFIDEVQDLAWYDLEILKLLFKSESNILLVWDPRQWTYSTNNSAKNKKYARSQIINFFEDETLIKWLEIDDKSLTINYRCNDKICSFSNKIFPNLKQTTSDQNFITWHDWVFVIREKDIDEYLKRNSSCMQLREKITTKWVREKYNVMNFGESKWLDFERILIYPTEPIKKWIKENRSELAPTSRSKFYVAVTRAKYSVAIVYDFANEEILEGIEKYLLS